MKFHQTLRAISCVVLASFTSLTLQPVSAALQITRAKAASAPQPESADEKYSRKLDDIKEQTQRAKSKRKEGKPAKDEVKTMRSHKKDLEALEVDIDASFDTQEQSLLARNLPQAILDRHTQAKADFKARQREFKNVLKNLEDADDKDDDNERDGSLDTIDSFFKKYQQGKTHTPVDPNKLPFRVADDKVRPPATDGKSFALTAGKTLAAGTAKALPAAPTPEDLAQTEDVQITPAIQALADSLNKNPVKIYNWVHNNIEFLPTYGSIQGSDMTLLAKRGNAFDTASLLIALYRAAGIPSRYAYGTIEVPVDQAMNWVGGVTKSEAAQQLLGQGGIPNIGVIAGGAIKSIKLEHVWVDAWVDYVPSRGAVNRAGDTWVPVDASFKQYQMQPGNNLRPQLGVDISALNSKISSNILSNPLYGSVTGYDQPALNDLFEAVRNDVSYAYGTQFSVSDFTGSRKIVAFNYSILTGTLPYKRVTQFSSYASLPDTLRHKVVLNFYQNAFDRALGSPGSSFSVSLPALSGRRLGVTYLPATAADATALQNFRDSPSYTSLPLYLIKVKPVVQLDGITQLEAAAGTMGEEQFWEVQLQSPAATNDHQHVFTVTAGDELVFGLDRNGVTKDIIHQRFVQHTSDTAAENLHTVSLYYWAQYDALNEVAAVAQKTAVQRLVSVGLFAAPLKVAYWFGIPRSGYYSSRYMDVSQSIVAATQQDGTRATDFLKTSGTIGSFLEGRTFDGLLKHEVGTGVSAVQLLREANEQRIPIYLVTADNYSLVRPKLAIDQSILVDIANAVQAGKQVIIPQTAPTHGNWAGIGYVVEDPQTGAAAYLIKGGLNGGVDDPCNPEQKKEPVKLSILEILLIALIIIAILALLLLQPEIVLAFAVGAQWAGRLAAILGLGAATAPAFAQPLLPGPGDGMTPPGDCSVGQQLALQAAVDQYCHGTPSCRSYPRQGASCPALQQLKDTWLNCALARTTINNTCFRGGNIGHREAEIGAYNAVATCECRLVENGCPP